MVLWLWQQVTQVLGGLAQLRRPQALPLRPLQGRLLGFVNPGVLGCGHPPVLALSSGPPSPPREDT